MARTITSRFDVETDCQNLDGMFPDDLREWAMNIPRGIPAEIRGKLALYATLKAGAMELRASGSIPQALAAESQCDRIYQSLPEAYRW